jgi:Fe2+ or Zn2+ uptake regulation protein
MRTNIYKEKILTLLRKKHLLTIAEIHKAIPDADYSTVFRNIEQLLTDKEIKRIMVDNKSVAYESASESHDHFICNDCGTVETIDIPHNSIKGRKVDDITVRGSCNKCDK